MTKKGKKKNAGKAKPQTKSKPRLTETQALKEVIKSPAFGHSTDHKKADEYRAAFMAFEDWVTAGKPEEGLDPASLPLEHRSMMEFWPEAFEVYRHAMWTYLERTLNLNPWTAEIRSLMLRVRSIDPTGFAEFLNQIDSGVERFVEQKRNAILMHNNLGTHATVREDVEATLALYAKYYEIDFPMWFLAVLGKAIKDGRVNPTAFGGPNSSTPQGSLIESTVEALKETPLERPIAEAYDAELRNAIQHNDYKLKISPGEITASTLDGSRKWRGDQLWDSVMGTAQIVNATQTVAAYIRAVDDPRATAEFADVGLMACLYSGWKDSLPEIVVMQLWCFHIMDLQGNWLDAATIRFEELGDGNVRVHFTEKGYTVGTDVREALRDSEGNLPTWARVRRVPVAPDLGMRYPKVRAGQAMSYEVVGVPDIHMVRIAND